jgi:hypothetical protein
MVTRALLIRFRVILLCLLLSFSRAAFPNEFELIRITQNLISAPQYAYAGAEQFPTSQRERWLEVEVEFVAAPPFTDELTFRYFILLNGQVLTGEVTHVNIAGGREKRSVIYVPPRVLARFNNNRSAVVGSVQNIGVRIVQSGAIKNELSLFRAPGPWQTTIPTLSGFLLNKNATPFAPLYWDRYEQIKPDR